MTSKGGKTNETGNAAATRVNPIIAVREPMKESILTPTFQ